MAKNNGDEPRTLEIRKYQNRRYYDSTCSRHLSLQQIHKLIIEGYNIRVLDAKTNEDITSKVLTQIGQIWSWTRRIQKLLAAALPMSFGFRGHDPEKILCKCNKCWRISEIRAMFYPEAQESPGALTKKQGKNMSNEATQKATAATSEAIDKVFQEAMRSYEKALKSGIQLQEESVNLWKDLLTKLGSPEEFQAKLESMTAEAFPKARKRLEEFVETFNRTSNQTIDLFEKTLGVYQATSVPDAQRRVHDLIESSLAALRVNVHSALDTNAKIIGDWKELVDRFGPAVK
jgi:polyhydroxyalkanoate synthesis repressor PhaR